MKHTYAINDLYLYQFDSESGYWFLINDETGKADDEGRSEVDADDFDEDAFTIFEDEDDMLSLDMDAEAFEIREFVIEAAQTHLVDRDNGGLDCTESNI